MLKGLRRVILAALVAVPFASFAGVFLNGVPIDGVRNHTFEKATVRIDAQGNVHIEAPGYKVSGAAAQAAPAQAPTEAAAPAGRITRRYFLVTSQSERGATQYDIDVYVNARWIRKLKSDSEQIVDDITKYLVPGENRVMFIAHKDMTQGRKSASPQHYFRVLLGEGAAGGNKIMLDRTLVEFKRSADQVDDVSREFTFTTR